MVIAFPEMAFPVKGHVAFSVSVAVIVTWFVG